MIYASIYMRKINETHKYGWGNCVIYESIDEFRKYNESTEILLPLDSGYFIGFHSKYVFPIGTNIISVSRNERTIHIYRGYEIVWTAGFNNKYEPINFDNLPRD